MIDLNELRQEVKAIVKREDVRYVIGYEAGTYGWRVSPCFAKTPEEVERFIFSPLCVQNLTTYVVMEDRLPLPESGDDGNKKIGVIVKGCDSRAIMLLLQEHAISREDVIIIGVPCRGVIDPRKMQEKFGDYPAKVTITEEEDIYLIDLHDPSTGTVRMSRSELVSDMCMTCQYPNPVICDLLPGDEIQEIANGSYPIIQKLEQQLLEARWEYWKRQFERCIRCYACKNVCPVCHCEECLGTQVQPTWIRRSVNLSENTAFHVMRAFHMAGRCVACGMCEKACPVNIPLTRLYKKVEQDVLTLFNYTAGINSEAEPLLSTYHIDDTNEGIL